MSWWANKPSTTSSTSDGSSKERTYKGWNDKKPKKTTDGSKPSKKGK